MTGWTLPPKLRGMTREEILQEIETFLAESGMSAPTFGRRVAQDTKFVGRIRNGSDMTTKMANRVLGFIKEQRQQTAA